MIHLTVIYTTNMGTHVKQVFWGSLKASNLNFTAVLLVIPQFALYMYMYQYKNINNFHKSTRNISILSLHHCIEPGNVHDQIARLKPASKSRAYDTINEIVNILFPFLPVQIIMAEPVEDTLPHRILKLQVLHQRQIYCILHNPSQKI